MPSSGLWEPEWQVLVCAGLDSLARHWAATLRPELKSHAASRMGEFLTAHGPRDVFGRVSAPHLLHRAIGEKKLIRLRPAIRRYLGQEGSPGAVRTWKDDPTLAIILADKDIGPKCEEWVKKSRYGEVLYHELRCTWLHEFRKSDVVADPYDHEADAPRYQNFTSMLDGKPYWRQRLMFPVKFLTRAYGESVKSFERACIDARVAPTPEDNA